LFLTPTVCLYKLLKYAGVIRASWYYYKRVKTIDKRIQNKGRKPPGHTLNRNDTIVRDEEIIFILKQYRNQIEFHNGGGYIKLTHYLKKEHGLYINKKKIYRLCKANNLLLERKKKHKKPWKTINSNHVITTPNQMYEFDIKYGFVHGENRFFFVLAFVDVFSRKVVGKYVGSHCKTGDLTFTLTETLKNENIKSEHRLTIRSDNGTQMSSNIFYKYLQKLENNLCHEFIPPATPNKNAHVESFFSILEIEFMQTRYFHSMAEAYEQTQDFIQFYNERRIHKSLNYRTPNDILLDFKNGKTLSIKPVSL
jgi:putative transposase